MQNVSTVAKLAGMVALLMLGVMALGAIQTAPGGHVATLAVETVLRGSGQLAMAVLMLVSTFGTVNTLTLTGARACYAMAQGGLFFRKRDT